MASLKILDCEMREVHLTSVSALGLCGCFGLNPSDSG
jgi:hypothetical protein